jgi:hypothetical protein
LWRLLAFSVADCCCCCCCCCWLFGILVICGTAAARGWVRITVAQVCTGRPSVRPLFRYFRYCRPRRRAI